MKRLFVAVKINPDAGFLNQFRKLKSDLRHEKIKWVEEKNIHITLKFLGETDENRIPLIQSILEETALGINPFSFSLARTGIFGSSYAPKVVWAGIQPYDEMRDLMKKIHRVLEKAGFEADRQNLVPHLTLGRIKYLDDKKLFADVLDKNSELKSEKMTVDEFRLYESILKKEGPQYIVLKNFFLKK